MSKTSHNFATACPLDCPDTCSLEVEVSDNRVTKIRGSSRNPTTADFICSKVASFGKRVYGSERLLHPMKRTGAKGEAAFERISWEEAITAICERTHEIVKHWGGEAILPYSYGGSNGLLGQDTIDKAFFAKLGASRLARAVCAAPTGEAAAGMYGKMAGVAFEDFAHARFIIVWGANPKASNIHLVPFLKAAKASGAKIAVIDPVRNFSARELDYHLPVLPGTDLLVALAMINYWEVNGHLNWDFIRRHCTGAETLLERARTVTTATAAAAAGVDERLIEQIAREYAATDPAVIRIGWGLERNRNGGQAAAAILAIPALLGKFGRRGGGYTLSNSAAFRYDEQKVIETAPWRTREINMNLLGRRLLSEKTPPIKMLFVYNCNPVATVPNQNAILAGLQREDLFTVVFDQVMTDTAAYADVLLPAVTFLEQQEVKKAYGSYALQLIEPVIPPRGEAKPNEQVFAELGRAMGWRDSVFHIDSDELVDKALAAVAGLGAHNSNGKLRRDKIAFFDFPGKTPVQFENVFPNTPDRKAHLAPAQLGKAPFEFIPAKGGATYPLVLISPATDKSINSTLAEHGIPELYVALHPDDAAARGLVLGRLVKVVNGWGEVHCRLQIQTNVRPGVACMPKGAWRRASRNGQTATALAPDTISAVGGGACFNDARVEVLPLNLEPSHDDTHDR